MLAVAAGSGAAAVLALALAAWLVWRRRGLIMATSAMGGVHQGGIANALGRAAQAPEAMQSNPMRQAVATHAKFRV